VTTLDYKKADKNGPFSIYKPGQGKYVRWGTVAGAGLVILLGAWWIGNVLQPYGQIAPVVGAGVWVLVLALFTFWLVNKPRFAEFLIMTESEMRKVTWPTRKGVFNSTRIVILMTFLLAGILATVDVAFSKLFHVMGIL
jgi:preprotein translocase subunit SecE